METPKLLTDDMDIRDTEFSMFIGGNGDYYLELKETKRGEVIKLDTRIAMSGGNATPEVRQAVVRLFKALRGETLLDASVLNIPIVSVSVCSCDKPHFRQTPKGVRCFKCKGFKFKQTEL